MEKYSPNWYWNALGFNVIRNGSIRTIVDAFGRTVCIKAGYDAELSIASMLYEGF